MSAFDAHTAAPNSVAALNERSRDIFRHIVEAYVETGEPVGSRTIARKLNGSLSPATIRNVMADLEYAGLLYAPHTSAGRLPSEAGLRMFVSGLLQVGGLDAEERRAMDAHCQAAGRSTEEVLSQATGALAGLAQCASIVLAPKNDVPLKHIEFVLLKPGRALAEAGNFLSARLAGRTLPETRKEILAELSSRRAQLNEITSGLVEQGLATWGGEANHNALIVKGQSHLLNNIKALEDLERVRQLFAALETREQIVRVLDLVGKSDGVQIFIGAQNELFGMTGCSMVVAPFLNSREQIVGAIGVVGPTRLNYARIIPMVDYTAKLVGRVLGQ